VTPTYVRGAYVRYLGEWQTNTNTNTIFSHLQPARVVRSPPNFAWW